MSVTIENIGYFLPNTILTNTEIGSDHPDWDMAALEQKTGVKERHVASSNETALDLAISAWRKIETNSPNSVREIDGILFCTQSPDWIMPPNSYLFMEALGIGGGIFAYDFNLACSGYVYGLVMANCFIAAGVAKKIALINADTYSKYIDDDDRPTKVLFGDGAAISIIVETKGSKGLIDSSFQSDGSRYDTFFLPSGGTRLIDDGTHYRKARSAGRIGSGRRDKVKMDGMAVWSAVNSVVPQQVSKLIQDNGYKTSDIDLFIFHQASQMALESLMGLLKLGEEQMFSNLSDKGNTVSASIPIAIKDAENLGRLKRGDLIVVAGFGVGMSYAVALMEY